MDAWLSSYAALAKSVFKDADASYPGAGAAGGLGFGLMAFLGARLTKGIEYVLDKTDFSEKIKDADLIITGEGKLDRQSLMGKVPFHVAEKSKGKRVLALVGVSEVTPDEAKKKGISETVETNPMHLPFKEIENRAKQMLIDAIENIIV